MWQSSGLWMPVGWSLLWHGCDKPYQWIRMWRARWPRQPFPLLWGKNEDLTCVLSLEELLACNHTKHLLQTLFSVITRLDCSHTHFLWNMTTASDLRSWRSSLRPFSITSGCFRTKSQPICEKKKPLTALWGSASVSENLWCTRWSLAHS